jgi:hypothetical protein
VANPGVVQEAAVVIIVGSFGVVSCSDILKKVLDELVQTPLEAVNV